MAGGLAPREGAPRAIGLGAKPEVQFCWKQDLSICLDGKEKLCGAKNLVLLDNYCYVKRRVKPAPNVYMGGVWRRRPAIMADHIPLKVWPVSAEFLLSFSTKRFPDSYKLAGWRLRR
jgi:hypothetical protein